MFNRNQKKNLTHKVLICVGVFFPEIKITPTGSKIYVHTLLIDRLTTRGSFSVHNTRSTRYYEVQQATLSLSSDGLADHQAGAERDRVAAQRHHTARVQHQRAPRHVHRHGDARRESGEAPVQAVKMHASVFLWSL